MQVTGDSIWPLELPEDLNAEMFRFPLRNDNMCYMNANLMTRLDTKESFMLDENNAKQIFVVNPSDSPTFSVPPQSNFVMRSGDPLKIYLSDYSDPEGFEVRVNVDFGQAAEFAFYNAVDHTIEIPKNATIYGKDEGFYQINIELIELIKGA